MHSHKIGRKPHPTTKQRREAEKRAKADWEAAKRAREENEAARRLREKGHSGNTTDGRWEFKRKSWGH